MAEHEFERIRTGGLFSKRVKVLFETKLVRMLSRGEVNASGLYTEDGSRRLGYCEFKYENGEGQITNLIIDDTSNPQYASRLLRYVVPKLKKKGAKVVTAEIYDKDSTTRLKLEAFKKAKFKRASGGAAVGYSRYLFKRKL